MANIQSSRRYTLLVSLAAAFGGLLFGYDTAVISGVIAPVKDQFNLSAVSEGWFVSSGLWGCIIGVLLAGLLSNAIGRKKVLILSGITFLLSALGCAFAGNSEVLVASRLIGGIGVGIASVISPMYITEFAPAAKRGMLVACYQLAITIGIFMAYLVNALIASSADQFAGTDGLSLLFGAEAWRGMFLMMAVPSILFIFILIFIPESIRYLISKGKLESAKNILFRTREPELAQEEWKLISAPAVDSATGKTKTDWTAVRLPLIIGIFLAFFQQFSGINAVIYYGPEIFAKANIPSDNALLFQSIIGAVNILFTFVAIVYADKAGRRTLLLYGLTGLIISLVSIGFIFQMESTPGFLLLFMMLAYIACFALSLGPVTWIVINEIFPSSFRVQGVTICTLAVWLAVALLGQFFPLMLEHLGTANTFWLFALCCIAHLIFSYYYIPETKGKQLEDVEKLFGGH